MKVRAEVIRIQSEGDKALVQMQAPIKGAKSFGLFTLAIPTYLAHGYFLGRIVEIVIRPR
jgi:hypothetical protein